MYWRSNSATTSPFLTRRPALGSSSRTSAKSPPLPIDPPPPPPLPIEAGGRLPAVEPRPEPIALLLVPLLLEADEDDELFVMRSVKRLVVRESLPGWPPLNWSRRWKTTTCYWRCWRSHRRGGGLDELAVVVVAAGAGELANILAEADMALRDEPRLPL